MSISYLIFHMKELDISKVYNMLAIPKDTNAFLGISEVNITPALFNLSNNGNNPGRLLASPIQIESFQEMFGVNGIMVQTQRSLGL